MTASVQEAIALLESRTLLSGANPLTAIPALSSNPSAPATLYLDFDGDPASTWFIAPVSETPAYDQDGDPSSFSDGELSSIRAIWARVAEKYAPFNINVTTVNPGSFANDTLNLHVVIGGNGAWTGGGLGGTSYVGAFHLGYPNVVYAFSAVLNGGDPTMVGEVAAHESGHTFGLEHQSLYGPGGGAWINEYNPGNALVAPIMGRSYYAARGVWSNGQSTSATTYQDDMAVIAAANNGFGYRPDDHGNSAGAAAALSLSGSSLSGSGVIEQTTDADYFSFTTSGGAVSFTAAVGSYVLGQTGASAGATLDLQFELRDASGNLITSADTASLGETLSANLAAGTYYLVVRSHGAYGDVGTYAISGTAPQAPSVIVSGSEELAHVSDVAGSSSGMGKGAGAHAGHGQARIDQHKLAAVVEQRIFCPPSRVNVRKLRFQLEVFDTPWDLFIRPI
jgi:hypothetical protein